MLRRTNFEADNVWAQGSICGGVGITLFGLEMLLLGHLNALTRPALAMSSLVIIIGLFRAWPDIRKQRSVLFSRVRACVRQERVLALSCALMFALVALSGLRAPREGDELDYHWAAPVFWAQQGRWAASPYRLTNGPALMEMNYTFSACFGSSSAAHWSHTLCLFVLALACAGLARTLGVSPLAAVAACLSCPVIVNQASIAYNDVAAGALVLCAYAALVCRKEGDESAPLPGNSLLIAGILFAGAVSVKPFTLVALPPALLYVYCYGLRAGKGSGSVTGLRNMGLISGCVALTLCLWAWHTHSLIGHVWDSSGKYMARQPSDSMWQTGQAAGRIPSLTDLAVLPTVPFVTGILGQREPYGGRTGLLALLFAPIGLSVMHLLSASRRRRLYWLVGAAVAYFLLLGPVALKTRFHIFVWCVGMVVAAIGYSHTKNGRTVIPPRLSVGAYYLLVWIGMTDGARILLRHISSIIR